MRVLFLNSCVSGGGPGRGLTLYLSNVGSELEPHVLMPEPGVVGPKLAKGTTTHYVPEFVERILMPPYALARKVPGVNLAGGVFALSVATFKIIELARKLKPDIIYCNHMLAKPIGAIVGTALNVPVVFHARNIHDNFWIERHFYQSIARLKAVRLIISNSEASARPYAEVAPDKVKVVPNFVDLARFDRTLVTPLLRQELGFAPDVPIIGYAGRIVRWKGIDRLIRAFAEVHERFPRAVLVVLGGNDGGLRGDLQSEYQQLAAGLGVDKKTHFIGFRDDVRPYMADMDMLALPSVRPEPFGRVLAEAMALGVPAIITAHGGATEVVRRGLDGLWAEPDNVNDLASAIATMLGDEESRHRMGERAAASVRERYDSRRLSAEITDLMRSIAA